MKKHMSYILMLDCVCLHLHHSRRMSFVVKPVTLSPFELTRYERHCVPFVPHLGGAADGLLALHEMMHQLSKAPPGRPQFGEMNSLAADQWLKQKTTCLKKYDLNMAKTN